jgi:hypothetical protein
MVSYNQSKNTTKEASKQQYAKASIATKGTTTFESIAVVNCSNNKETVFGCLEHHFFHHLLVVMCFLEFADLPTNLLVSFSIVFTPTTNSSLSSSPNNAQYDISEQA